jgi:hypothetical protein
MILISEIAKDITQMNRKEDSKERLRLSKRKIHISDAQIIAKLNNDFSLHSSYKYV